MVSEARAALEVFRDLPWISPSGLLGFAQRFIIMGAADSILKVPFLRG